MAEARTGGDAAQALGHAGRCGQRGALASVAGGAVHHGPDRARKRRRGMIAAAMSMRWSAGYLVWVPFELYVKRRSSLIEGERQLRCIVTRVFGWNFNPFFGVEFRRDLRFF